MTEPQILTVNPSLIHDSPLNYRTTYDSGTIANLAGSMLERTKVGLPALIERILVRRREDGELEAIVGHRRKRAAIEAGVPVQVEVVEMTDEQVMDTQVVENVQREDVHPIEEVDAMKRLYALGRNASEIAARLGCSVGYVQSRMRLGKLHPSLAILTRYDVIELEAAYVFARLPEEEQVELFLSMSKSKPEEVATTEAAEELAKQWIAEDYERVESRDVLWRLRTQLPVLDERVFPLDEKVGKVGPCLTCPKNTIQQSTLFTDAMSRESNEDEMRCTDRACYDAKSEAHWPTLMKVAKNQGITVLKAKKPKYKKTVIFEGSNVRYDVDVLNLDERHVEYVNGQAYTRRQILGELEDMSVIHLARNPHTGRPTYLIDKDVFKKALSAFKRKHGVSGSSSSGEKEKPPEEPKALQAFLEGKEVLRREREDRKASRAIFRDLKGALRDLIDADNSPDPEAGIAPLTTERHVTQALAYGIGALVERAYGLYHTEDRNLVYESLADVADNGSAADVVGFLLLLVEQSIHYEGWDNLGGGFSLAFAESLGLDAESIREKYMAPIREKREKREKRDSKKVERAAKKADASTEEEEE